MTERMQQLRSEIGSEMRDIAIRADSATKRQVKREILSEMLNPILDRIDVLEQRLNGNDQRLNGF